MRQNKKKTIGSHITIEIIIIILGILLALLCIKLLTKRANEIILPMAEVKARKYITEVINNSTDKIMFNDDLFVIEKNNGNEIKMITYNSYEATRLINEITKNIESKLNIQGDKLYVIDEIPLGVIFNNSLLSNLGPRIKVRIDIIGDVLSELCLGRGKS